MRPARRPTPFGGRASRISEPGGAGQEAELPGALAPDPGLAAGLVSDFAGDLVADSDEDPPPFVELDEAASVALAAPEPSPFFW